MVVDRQTKTEFVLLKQHVFPVTEHEYNIVYNIILLGINCTFY